MADQRPIEVFDPQRVVKLVERRLPHWSQAGTITFITWRTWDSMPQRVIRTWQSERDAWLCRNGIDPAVLLTLRVRKRCDRSILDEDGRNRVSPRAERGEYRLDALPPEKRRLFRQFVSDRWNDHLDGLHGACVLRRRELADIVAASLRHFDGDRYDLTDFVVMPNHVHLLAAFPDEDAMLVQCESWKRYTAMRINRILGRRGRFWQQDGFDHLVRSEEQFDHLRRYIAGNPTRAGLGPGQFVLYSSRSA